MSSIECDPSSQDSSFISSGVFSTSIKMRFYPSEPMDGRAFQPKFRNNKNQLLVFYRHMVMENKTLRKPCLVCGTLVKPELQEEHNEAYHPLK